MNPIDKIYRRLLNTRTPQIVAELPEGKWKWIGKKFVKVEEEAEDGPDS